MAVRKFLDASTKHVTEHDMELLTQHIGPSAIWQHPDEYAVLFYVPDEPRESNEESTDEDQRLSDAFWAVVERAKQLDCDYVMLDCDGPLVNGLEWFEW